MNTHERDDALLRAAARLPESIEPPRDLWPGIAAQLGTQERDNAPARPWLLALAASVALVAVTAGVTWRIAVERPAAPAPTPVAATTTTPAPETPTTATGELMFLRAQLLDTLDDNLARLPADSQRVIVDNLLVIRASLSAIEEALAADPNNPSLQQLLYTTYEQELSVLADVNRLALTLPTEVET